MRLPVRLSLSLPAFALAACAAAPALAPPATAPAAASIAAASSTPARAPAAARGQRMLQIANAGFESGMKAEGRCAVGWDCTMHNNPESFRFSLLESGAAVQRRALCVERVADEPWALVTQALQTPELRGRRLRLSLSVRVEGAAGAGAGPWVLAQGRPPVNARRLLSGTAGWERLAVEFSVPADTSVVEVGATLEGPGKACFDDVRLELL